MTDKPLIKLATPGAAASRSVAVNPFSVAPMMEWTDRNCRFFHRCLSRHALLYTEMVTVGAILHGDRERLLGFDPAELPLALQLGGADPQQLADCAKIGEDYGYSEINMNVGCPSDRVQSGRFGACLMAEPELVARCVAAMQSRVSIPVTVKCRVGIDRDDDYEPFERFIAAVSEAGCNTFIVHARKAWLDGLSPKENRDVPPLRYEFVSRAKEQFPQLNFILNGGLPDHAAVQPHLQLLDGVMLGRAAYRNPWLLSDVDERYFSAPSAVADRFAVVEKMYPYIETQLASGASLGHIMRHMLGLFQAQPGGRQWRRELSQNAWQRGADLKVVSAALERVRDCYARAA